MPTVALTYDAVTAGPPGRAGRTCSPAAKPFAVLRGTGQGASTLASDYNHQDFAASQRRFPYATTVDPGADAYVRLRPGRYFVFDAMHRGTWTAVKRFVAHRASRRSGRARPVFTLAQTAAPNATIYNPEHLKAGREMLISFRNLDGKLHHGRARLVTVR